MKDEIKEILNKLKDIDKTSILKNNDAKIILDYITNLQNGFKSTVEELCETTEELEGYKQERERILNKLDYVKKNKELQEKYERMKENAEILSKGYNDLEKRNEKAIEYNNHLMEHAKYHLNLGHLKKMDKILKGVDTNE